MSDDRKLEEPFARAVEETFEKMLGASVTRRTPDPNAPRDVTAVIGFGGGRKGAISMSFTEEVACRVVSRFAGETIDNLGPDVIDGVGELLNIIAGRAKSLISRDQGAIGISIPTVVVGREHEVHGATGLQPPLQISFDSELGRFEVFVLIERPRAPVARVLVADDSRVMRKLLKSAMKELFAEVDVVEAENGAVARRHLEAAGDKFDLVVLDIHMPELNGTALLEEVRKRPTGARLPVLIATSDPDAERLVAEAEGRAGTVGPVRIMKKPFTTVELVAAARQIAPAAVGASS